MFACPSAPAEPGAGLLGILGADGRIAHLKTAMRVDAEFLALARRTGPPEARMRFSGTCRTGACQQWTGHSCGVIERVLGRIGGQAAPGALPPCTIRGTCRWYHQEGAVACAACSDVITETRVAALVR
jgi:hypothetical protein